MAELIKENPRQTLIAPLTVAKALIQFVWKVETGERRIDPIEFIAWCRACGLQPSKVIDELER